MSVNSTRKAFCRMKSFNEPIGHVDAKIDNDGVERVPVAVDGNAEAKLVAGLDRMRFVLRD
jgi:hypothetical protein